MKLSNYDTSEDGIMQIECHKRAIYILESIKWYENSITEKYRRMDESEEIEKDYSFIELFSNQIKTLKRQYNREIKKIKKITKTP
ncbi:MAG: hypothetical protein RLY43_2474 [Bacteroidota bacterium]|jgi:hypothetical protein